MIKTNYSKCYNLKEKPSTHLREKNFSNSCKTGIFCRLRRFKEGFSYPENQGFSGSFNSKKTMFSGPKKCRCIFQVYKLKMKGGFLS